MGDEDIKEYIETIKIPAEGLVTSFGSAPSSYSISGTIKDAANEYNVHIDLGKTYVTLDDGTSLNPSQVSNMFKNRLPLAYNLIDIDCEITAKKVLSLLCVIGLVPKGEESKMLWTVQEDGTGKEVRITSEDLVQLLTNQGCILFFWRQDVIRIRTPKWYIKIPCAYCNRILQTLIQYKLTSVIVS